MDGRWCVSPLQDPLLVQGVQDPLFIQGERDIGLGSGENVSSLHPVIHGMSAFSGLDIDPETHPNLYHLSFLHKMRPHPGGGLGLA